MVFEYAALRGSLDGMDTTVITEIADYFKNEIGYNIPPMTPFVGSAFNVTSAGVHADGLMKDEEIYTIFDTKKILNKPLWCKSEIRAGGLLNSNHILITAGGAGNTTSTPHW